MLENLVIGWKVIEPVFMVNIALKNPLFYSADTVRARQPAPRRLQRFMVKNRSGSMMRQKMT